MNGTISNIGTLTIPQDQPVTALPPAGIVLSATSIGTVGTIDTTSTLAAAAPAAPTPGVGTMTIDLVTASGSAAIPAAAQQALDYAAKSLGSLIHDNVTVDISVSFSDNGANDALATGGPNTVFWEPLSTVENAIARQSPDLASGLPASLPSGAYGSILVSSAEMKTWGLPMPSTPQIDGQINFNTYYFNNPNYASVSYNLDPSSISGLHFDFVGTALHELTHALGRISSSTAQVNGGAEFSPFDLFKYAAPGQLYTGQSNVTPYFSTDGGQTTLATFAAADPADWQAGSPLTPHDAFALSTAGAATISGVDLKALGAIGFATGAPSVGAVTATLGIGADTVLGSTPALVMASGNNVVTTGSGNDTVKAESGSVTIDASSGTASVRGSVPKGYAGTLNFIGGAGGGLVIGGAGTVTYHGGAGAATVDGGSGGNNSIIGGSGALFADGGGNNSVVIANAPGTNYLFAGIGLETLIAGAGTKTNLFKVNSGAGGDVMSSNGSGAQNFFICGGTSTMTGSTVAGAQNIFFAGTEHGGACVITNFASTDSMIACFNNTSVQGVAATVYNGTAGTAIDLTDGTRITLLGVTASSLTYRIGGTSVT